MNLSKLKKLKDWTLAKNTVLVDGYIGYTFKHYRKFDKLGLIYLDFKIIQSKTAAGLWKKIEKYLEGR